MTGIHIRHAEPSDYQPVISVVDDWWGGRKMADMLPKLFFVYFRPTSFVAEHGGKIVGFLIGFASQTLPNEAYIHFVGVDPDFQKKGVGRLLYSRFFAAVTKLGRNVVRCVTSPVNKESVAFHIRMGFAMEKGDRVIDGLPVAEDYDGRTNDRVLFHKTLNT